MNEQISIIADALEKMNQETTDYQECLMIHAMSNLLNSLANYVYNIKNEETSVNTHD